MRDIQPKERKKVKEKTRPWYRNTLSHSISLCADYTLNDIDKYKFVRRIQTNSRGDTTK